jgi:hypothetical protein
MISMASGGCQPTDRSHKRRTPSDMPPTGPVRPGHPMIDASPPMKPTPDKPARTRRRRAIVVILLLVSFTTWWYWPRGDARFVGKWQFVVVKSGQETISGEEFRFYRHGWVYHRAGQERFQKPMRWSVEGNELVLGVDWPVPNYGLQPWLRRIWNRATGLAKPLRSEILKVTPDEIHTRSAKRPENGIGIFRRIPE